MLLQHFLLALYWMLFCALHSILATSKFKVFFKRYFPNVFAYYRLVYTLFAVLTLALVVAFQTGMKNIFVYQPVLPLTVAAALLLLAGLTIMLICIRKYFINLSGIKSLVWEKEIKNELRIDGIHRYLRHPLYLGTFITIWSLFLMLPLSSLLVANLAITVYTCYAITWEEKKLVKEFGDAYRHYQRSVPKLFPKWINWKNQRSGH